MDPEKIIRGRRILIVDDEEDVLETLIDLLAMCRIDTATSFEEGKELLESRDYDVAVLDIMGVKGFDLLDIAVSRNIPALMLTAHALSPESLKKSIKLGAVTFLPKEKMSELSSYLEDVYTEGGKPIWKKLFDRMGGYFNKRFGPDWKEKDKFFKEFEEELKKDLSD